MRETSKTRQAANIFITAATTSLLGGALFAALDWDGVVSGKAFALFCVGGALTVLGLTMNGRHLARSGVRTVTAAVAKAPQHAYYRGYGDCAEDVFDPKPDPEDPPT